MTKRPRCAFASTDFACPVAKRGLALLRPHSEQPVGNLRAVHVRAHLVCGRDAGRPRYLLVDAKDGGGAVWIAHRADEVGFEEWDRGRSSVGGLRLEADVDRDALLRLVDLDLQVQP